MDFSSDSKQDTNSAGSSSPTLAVPVIHSDVAPDSNEYGVRRRNRNGAQQIQEFICSCCGTRGNHNNAPAEPQDFKKKLRQCFDHKNLLLMFTVVAVTLGLVIGLLISQFANPSANTLKMLQFPGELLLRALNCMLVPLIVSSMVTSMTTLGNARQQGKIAFMTMFFYLTTTFLAVILGIVLVNLIQPGFRSQVSHTGEDPFHSSDKCKTNPNMDSLDTIMNIFRNLVPKNLIDAASNEIDCSLNVLGLIVFSLFMGSVLSQMEKKKAEPLINFFTSLNDVCMQMIMIIIWYAPIGIMFLIMWRLGKETGSKVWSILAQLAWYVLTIVVGLALHMFVTLGIIYTIILRRLPFKHIYGLSSALLTALGTASSNATLPLTIQCCEQNLKIKTRVARFVLPLGATVNMDGTALYEAVAAIFIAQSLGIQLSIGQNIIVALTATLASIGAAGIPEAGLVTLVMVMQSVGLPQDSIGMILAIDWFLDRLRTCVNVYGDTIGAAVVDRFTPADLFQEELGTEEDAGKEIQSTPSQQALMDSSSASIELNEK